MAKTRLQVEGRGIGLFKVLKNTWVKEGTQALWKGLAPALIRQTCYTSLSMVLYQPIRNLVTSDTKEVTFLARLFAGGSAGAIAIFVFNWAEVTKVKIQASKEKLRVLPVMKMVYENSGIRGFWAGCTPNIARTFIVNAAELGSYDQIKTEVLIPLVGDNPIAHIGSSGLAGVISAMVSTPVDVVKTRLMNEAGSSAKGSVSSNMFVRGTNIFREEGVSAMYSGFLPICIRKVLWCTAFFVSYEYLLPVFSVSTLTTLSQ